MLAFVANSNLLIQIHGQWALFIHCLCCLPLYHPLSSFSLVPLALLSVFNSQIRRDSWLRVSIEVFCTPQVAFREFSKIVEALFVLNSICTTNTEKVKQTQCKKTTKIIQKRLLPLKKSDT